MLLLASHKHYFTCMNIALSRGYNTSQNFEILKKSFRRRTQANQIKPTPILIIPFNEKTNIEESQETFFRSVIPSL